MIGLAILLNHNTWQWAWYEWVGIILGFGIPMVIGLAMVLLLVTWRLR